MKYQSLNTISGVAFRTEGRGRTKAEALRDFAIQMRAVEDAAYELPQLRVCVDTIVLAYAEPGGAFYVHIPLTAPDGFRPCRHFLSGETVRSALGRGLMHAASNALTPDTHQACLDALRDFPVHRTELLERIPWWIAASEAKKRGESDPHAWACAHYKEFSAPVPASAS